MPRTTGLVAIAIFAAATVASLSAQPANAECSEAEKDEVLATGRIPDFTRCHVRFAVSRIRQAFPNQFEVAALHDETATGFRPGMVTRQEQEGRRIRIYYAAAASQPTAATANIAGTVGATAAQDPPAPASDRVTFTIANAATVVEGQPLIFRVSRGGDDGRAHVLQLRYSANPGLLVDPPPEIRFEPGDASPKDLVVPTADGIPGDGSHDVQVFLVPTDDGAAIGAPRLAVGTITDAPSAAPPPEPVGYSITGQESVVRGNDLHFTVSRTGPLDPAAIPYRIVQDGTFSTLDGEPNRIEFAQGRREVPLVVPSDRFVCGGPVMVVLGGGAQASARVSFSDQPPAWCRPPPPPWWLEYLPLILGGFAFAGAVALDRIFKPFVKVHPSCTIVPGTPDFRALEQPVSRWPEITAEALIVAGECHVTQPLPRLEQAHG